MHRTFAKMRSRLLGGTLLALIVGGLATLSQAQPPPPMGSTVLVPLNGTTTIQMSTKKPIKKAVAVKDGVINIRPVPGDPTKILLVGQAPETTKLDLTDEDNKTETYEVFVQRDVDNLRAQLRWAIPTGSITVRPLNESTVLLTGTISKASDAPVIEQVVRALGFQPINQVMVGGVQQVQLDVVVAIVSRSNFRRMAFDFLTNGKNFYFASVGSGAVGTPATAGTAGALSSAATGLTATVGAPSGAPTNLLFGVLHNGYNMLGFLQALREENVLKLMAEPKLVTLSGTPGSFIDGGEQAIPVPAGLGQVGVQFEEFGTRLNFLPIVMGDGRIHLEVEPEVSSLDAANGVTIQGTVVPGRDTHRVHTTVQLEDGHTFVIGGLIQHQVIGSDDKVPVLGDMPFVGTLFRRMSYQETENEVIILVTPHLVEGFDCAQAPKILPGQETRSPDDFELFLEGILEAPRGQRCVFEDNHYLPAYKNGPSASVFPCGEDCPSCFGGRCGTNGCKSGCGEAGCANCGVAPHPMPAVTPAPVPQMQVAPQTPAVPQTLPAIPAAVPTQTQQIMVLPSDTAASTSPDAPLRVVEPQRTMEPLRMTPPPPPAPVPVPNTELTPNGGQLP